MTNTNDTQTMLAKFYGQLQAQRLLAEHKAKCKELIERTRLEMGEELPLTVDPDHFRVELTEHCVRVVESLSGKTAYSNSIYTCVQAATPIRNQLAHVVAKAMKNLFIARQMVNNSTRIGQRWREFDAQRDLMIPEEDNDVVRYVNTLKAETQKTVDGQHVGGQIYSSASLSVGVARAELTSACPTFTNAMKNSVDMFEFSYFSDVEDENAANRFVAALTERRVAAKLRTKAAVATLDAIRRNNRAKVGKPLADKFQAITGKVEQLPTLAEAQKEHEEASRLFAALDWLAAELELVPNTARTEDRLHRS